MEDLTFDDPCVVFALRRESAAFRREFPPNQRFPGAPCWARFCGPEWLTVLVLETGLGAAATEQALEWVLSRPVFGNVPYRPKVILSAGFCGALQEGYEIGDVILATEVVEPDGHRWPVTWPGELPPGEWRPPLHRGRLLTSSQLVPSTEEKHALGRQHEAVAVDMESAAVARVCSRQEVPFGCVRSVSDRLETPLSPELASLLSGGRVSPFRVVTTVARSPALGKEMWRLGRETRQAAEQLGRALGELLTLTLSWGRDL
jgi:adenosylhomocysteine nucleosidase